MIRPDSVPGEVLEAAGRGQVAAVASWDLAEEIAEVLRRPELARYGLAEADLEDVLFVLAPLLPDVDVEVVVPDPDDVPVISAAVAAEAEAIVTGDRGLLEHEGLERWLSERGVELLTPRGLLDRLAA